MPGAKKHLQKKRRSQGILGLTVIRRASINTKAYVLLAFLTVGMLAIISNHVQAAECDRNATDEASLGIEFSAASPGEVICLETGSYGTWLGGNKAVTITAAEHATPEIRLDFNNGDSGFTLDGLTILGGSAVNNVSNITIKNSTFTGHFVFDNVYNSNILFDNNTHINIEYSQFTGAGRISFIYGDGATHSGVTVQNSIFRGGSADGILTAVGVNIYNNEFADIKENGHPTAHTDSIQILNGYGSVIRGNYIHGGSTGIVGYDGVSNVTIEHNVVATNGRPDVIELYSDSNSVVEHNTVLGAIYLDHKPADPAGSGTIIKNNIATGVSKVNGSTVAEQTHNLLQWGTEPGDLSNIPNYIGGNNPTRYEGYLLHPYSPGKSAADDGDDIGIVFDGVLEPDITSPSVTLVSPVDEDSLSNTVTLSAMADDDRGIDGVTFRYNGITIGAEDITPPYSVDWVTNFVQNGSYTLTAVARDSSNNTTISEEVIVTINNNAPCECARSIWDGSAMPGENLDETIPVELGLKFRSEVAGEIQGVRFYKSAANIGTHVGRLWSGDGTELAAVTFTDETATGWQEALFSEPVSIEANTTYVVSYFSPTGRFSRTSSYFATNGFENYPLRALANDEDGANGVYHYGSGGVFPQTPAWMGGNYWVDVVFEVQDTLVPLVALTDPVEAALIRGQVEISADADDNTGIASVQFAYNCPDSCTNIGAADTESPYTIMWDTTLVPDGEYTLSAIATDNSGNINDDSITVTIDNTSPETIITLRPDDPSTSQSASFSFTANEAADFECKLDDAAFAACISPQIYNSLEVGSYTFRVRAIDEAGNVDASPALYSWTIAQATEPDPEPDTGGSSGHDGSHEGSENSGGAVSRPRAVSRGGQAEPLNDTIREEQTSDSGQLDDATQSGNDESSNNPKELVPQEKNNDSSRFNSVKTWSTRASVAVVLIFGSVYIYTKFIGSGRRS